MKKLFLAIVITAGFTSAAFAQTAATATPAQATSASKAVISFPVDAFDFGSVPQNIPVTHVFSFKNTGKEPLVLSSVTASCGCTTPEWPKEPVAPGATATIKATYNAANPGVFTKTITVVSNAATPTTVLTIKGDVKPAAAPAAANAAPAKAQSAAPKKN